jgi:hypothetical protein
MKRTQLSVFCTLSLGLIQTGCGSGTARSALEAPDGGPSSGGMPMASGGASVTPAAGGGAGAGGMDGSGGAAGAMASAGGNGGSHTTGGAGSTAAGGVGGGGRSSTGGRPSMGGSGGAGTGGANMGAGGFVPPVCASTSGLPANAPPLTTGQWVNISPPGVPFDANASAVTQGMSIDPCNPATLYVCVIVPTDTSKTGIYRTTDAGASWRRLGNLTNPLMVSIDPNDPKHLYTVDGVTGNTNGFWVSHDGGDTWTMPQGFRTAADAVHVYDSYHVEPDPTNFKHVLVTFHNYWQGTDGLAGIFESFDGGDSWTTHDPVPGTNWAGGYNVFFLYNPVLGIGDASTWLFGTQGKGYYRTTDSGKTWAKVTDVSMEHGGGMLYYSSQKVLYASGTPNIIKSTDNGKTWTPVGPQNGFLSVIGDGTSLYSGPHGGGNFIKASESSDTNWSNQDPQTFAEGPFQMALDGRNSILYSANIRAGVWALKTGNPAIKK